MSTRILLIGSGGREHALAWKLAQSELVSQIFAVPGNAGTARLNKVNNVSSVSADSFEDLLKFAVDNQVNLVVPGPEAPLVDGIVDYFREHGPASISCFGPSRAAARMEGSKAFAKDFMKRHSIPTAAYETFTDYSSAQLFLDAHPSTKWVIKASGLAAGKGVIIPETSAEAKNALKSIMLDREFGAAGDSVVIEEFLEGEELSILTLCDGYTIRSLPGAQDHKRALDEDRGPNTGGMGCYAPTPVATMRLMDRIDREIIQPSVDGMRNEGFPFVGCLFTGFVLTSSGPKVLEYNVRFGDPECQTILPLLESDLADILVRACKGYLSSLDLKISNQFCTTVIVAAGGYPGNYEKGLPMSLTDTNNDTYLFHAGTKLSSDGKIVTSGGRVIASTAWDETVRKSVDRAYAGVKCIGFDQMHYRRDIAFRALKVESKGLINVGEPLTYASAGVSIDAGNSLVQKIKAEVRATARPGCLSEIGGFGGEIVLPKAGYPPNSPTLVCAIDGIGTKLTLARATGIFNTIGIDLVAMNVNDLIVQGAEPLAFLDYYACSKLNVEEAADFVKGVADGCKQANSALIGGETAEMPGLYREGDWDAAGCAIGALRFDQRTLPAKGEMRVGDVLLGLSSSGCHSNGFSLIRKIIERAGLKYSDPAPWNQDATTGGSLLTPTKIYVRSLLRVLNPTSRDSAIIKTGIKGMAHITGGGLFENIPRMIPDHLAASMQVGSWSIPEVFRWLKREGGLTHEEFARSLNTGLGMVVVVEENEVDAIAGLLEDENEKVFRVGRLVERLDGEDRCQLQHPERFDV